jgi:hypothetical protein
MGRRGFRDAATHLLVSPETGLSHSTAVRRALNGVRLPAPALLLRSPPALFDWLSCGGHDGDLILTERPFSSLQPLRCWAVFPFRFSASAVISRDCVALHVGVTALMFVRLLGSRAQHEGVLI